MAPLFNIIKKHYHLFRNNRWTEIYKSGTYRVTYRVMLVLLED